MCIYVSGIYLLIYVIIATVSEESTNYFPIVYVFMSLFDQSLITAVKQVGTRPTPPDPHAVDMF